MKLYLTLEDDDGQKVEKKLLVKDINFLDTLVEIVYEMIDSLKESRKPL